MIRSIMNAKLSNKLLKSRMLLSNYLIMSNTEQKFEFDDFLSLNYR